MKIRIIKPAIKSGYFTNEEIEVNESQLELIKIYNEIKILESPIVSEEITPKKPINKRGRKPTDNK